MKTGMRVLGAVLALLGALGTAQAQFSIPDARVSLRVESRLLSDVVQYLREQSGQNIVVLEGGDAAISMDVTDVSWRDALELAVEMAGCTVEERTAGVLVVVRPPRVDFAFDNADIKQVIDTIAKLSGANIVIAPEVSGTLSLRLSNVPWRDALEVAVKTLGFVVVEEDRGILRVVDPLSLQAQMESHSYQLRYARPPARYSPIINSEFVENIQKAGAGQQGTGQIDYAKIFPLYASLKKALSPGGDLDYVPPPQNVIIVRDTAQVHATIKDMLDRLDIEPAQVFIDVKFVSSANRDLFNLGVDHGDLGPSVSYSGGQIPITFPFNLGAGGWEDLLIASPDGTGPDLAGAAVPQTIFGALSFTGWSGALRLLQRDTTTEVIQAPKIVALDGREATIFVGETVRYAQAKSEQGQAGGLQLSVEEADNSPVETGFQLLVHPHVIPGTNKVEMVIIPKETSLTGTGDPSVAPPGFDVYTVGASGLEGTIALPRERTSTIVTSTLLESGQTAILGGLSTDVDSEVVSEVPFFSDIPLLGWFFQHKSRTRDRQTLWVFITPQVIRSSAESQRLLEREVLRRQDAYGERLEQILFGDQAGAAGHVLLEEASATAGTTTVPPEDMSADQWATFVQDEPQAEPTTAPAPGTTPGTEPQATDPATDDPATDEEWTDDDWAPLPEEEPSEAPAEEPSASEDEPHQG
jgi:type II secretory pathway component GspD/PulD (secretin)